MLKAIIMDFDGLIVDTETATYQVFKECFSQNINYDLQAEEYLVCVGSNNQQLYNHLKVKGIEFDIECFEQDVANTLPERCKNLPARLGVPEFIKSIKDQGLSLVLATSSKSPKAFDHLTHLGLISYFDYIITADDVKNVKPEPDLFLLALKKLNVQANEALVIEDSQNGVVASNKARIPVIIVPNSITKLCPFDNYYKKINELSELKIEDLILDFENYR